MSKLYDMRQSLATSIIAASIGWTHQTVLIRRQSDFWNDVAGALAASRNGAVLHIGIAEGTSLDEEELEMEVTVPLTILCVPQVISGGRPEEDLWEDLVRHVSGLRMGDDLHAHRLRFKSFSDIEVQADGGTEYLGRQTIFQKRLSI